MKNAIPMMIDLTDEPCLIVGGGCVGERKARAFLEGKAQVTVVSPTITVGLQVMEQKGLIQWHPRKYRSDDGKSFGWVVAATDSVQVNQHVYHDARERRQWINVVDDPAHCNFTFTSKIRRGKLQIAIFTSGASPMLAKKIRMDLEQTYGTEYELYLDLLQEARERLRTINYSQQRRRILSELLTDNWLKECREHPETVREKFHTWLNHRMLNIQ